MRVPQKYRPKLNQKVEITTKKDGEVITGVLKKVLPEKLVLVDDNDKPIFVVMDDIETIDLVKE